MKLHYQTDMERQAEISVTVYGADAEKAVANRGYRQTWVTKDDIAERDPAWLKSFPDRKTAEQEVRDLAGFGVEPDGILAPRVVEESRRRGR